LADLGQSIGPNPKNPGLQLVKAYADDLAEMTSNGSVDLQRLMQLRLDLGRSLGKAPELKAIYSGILSDLEAAAARGGPGATLATGALQGFKQDLGANKFAQMVEAATKDSVAGGRGLNVATLHKALTTIPKNQTEPELLRLLGPDKYQQALKFTEEYRALPPAMAYTAANFLVNGLTAVGGAVAGGPLGAILGLGGMEVAKNAAMVGKNPASLNTILGTAGSMGRAAGAPQGPSTPTPVIPPALQKILQRQAGQVSP
ncbi:MAG TPA: hypothetical protein VJ816_08195, partial [Gemmatimonadales bacterium]|nr:hypothetical protein [Gemmatimonadales bacterium]